MKKLLKAIISINLAIQVLVAFVFGVLAGIFFGDMTSSIAFLGTAYIRLFQMPVIPYMVVSLISGLGKLNFKTAKSLAINAGVVMLGLWAIVVLILLFYSTGFPNWQSASFFTDSLIESVQEIDFVELFLPSNPFAAMANTIIPSVVTFSIAMGLSLIVLDDKKIVITYLEKIVESLLVITRFVARLSPIGVFAIAANAAGTLRLEDFGRLQIYIILNGLIAFALSLWILPKLVSVLTPIKYGDLIKEIREPIVTAFAVSNLLVVLPILVDSSKKLIDNAKTENGQKTDQSEDSPIDVIIPASFNFPNMGKLMSLAFIPFAAWYAGTPLSPAQYPTFIATGIPVFFADATLGTLFLLSLFKIPTNMLDIFITVEVFTGRFGTILAGMYTVTLAILSTCAMEGLLRFNRRKLIRFGMGSVLLIALIFGSVHAVFSYVFPQQYNKDQLLKSLTPLRIRDAQPAQLYQLDEVPPRIVGAGDNSEAPAPNRLEMIRSSKHLRVCFQDENYPLAYSNDQGDLVGMDIEMAHILGKDLGVAIEFIALRKDQGFFDFQELGQHLTSGVCDIVAPSVPLTPEGQTFINYSDSFVNRSVGFVVDGRNKQNFTSWQKMQQQPNLKIAMPANAPYYIAKLKGLLPNAEIVVKEDDIVEFITNDSDFAKYSALASSAETGAAFTLLSPNKAVAVPQPVVRFPAAYILPENSPDFNETVNVWLQLKQEDGTINSLNNYWVKGNLSSTEKPRWSIIRDVLGWIE
ncbi:MAG: cation:dicarboxylase symporter family transporter [Cyanobacteria bacterium P01_H01_bin.15]